MSQNKDKLSEEKKKIKEKEEKKKKEPIISTRPQRQRKLPKRWEDANLEVDLKVLDYANSNETVLNSKINETKTKVKLENESLNDKLIKNKENEVQKIKENIISDEEKVKEEIEEEIEEENEVKSQEESDVDNEWESDDDPDKLWCICRKPHDNRFMISCDKCKEWFHGSCVGVTQAKGAIYEKLEKKWFCNKCKDTSSNDRRPSLIKKNKPKSEKKEKPIPIAPESIKSDSIEIKKPNEFVNKEKLKLSKSLSEDKVQEQKLKDLIKTKKIEFNNKLNSSLNSSNTSIKSNDSDSKTDSETKNSDNDKSKSDKNCSKEDKKKRNSSLSLDPTFDDLFKAEPVIVQKKSSSTNNSSKRASISETILSCAYSDCKKLAQKINNKESVYCSKECIEKLVNNSISLVKQIKLSLAKTKVEKKSIEKDDKKVTLIEKKTGKYLSGTNAISEDKILDFIKNNPTFEILVPLNRKNSSNDEKSSSINNSKKMNNSLSSNLNKPKEKQKKHPEKQIKLSESETVRKNARKNLKRIFSTRLDTCKDIQLDKDEIKKIASKIESELFSLNKEVNVKYKTKIRSLIFNLSDIKNEGLFKKVLTKKITPDKLVKMGPEELASPELAKWRERENRHSLEMIKKDAEQQAFQVIVKKTHKGEEMIETKVQLPAFEETKKIDSLEKIDEKKNTLKPTKVVSAQEPTRTNPLDLLFKDTTNEHGQHLFDLHCNICTKQTKEDLSLVHKPKPLSNFEKNLLESVNMNIKDSKVEKNLNGSFETENQNDLNKDQINQKAIHSCWNGFINMQDVSKFMAFAYKVSGFFESQDILDSIQVCGRIAPEQVFYYLKKLKYSSRNEILVLKFIPANDEEKIGYESFFNYLNYRKRFGVVGNSGKAIKDFYILPLAKDQNVPEILLPLDGIGLEKKNHRPNLLLGILVRSRKHFSESKNDDKLGQSNSTNIKINTSSSMSEESVSNKRSYTPPPVFNSKSLSENSNSNSNEEISYTPPRNNDSKESLDEPYDPEETFLDLPTKKIKSEDHSKVKKEPSTKCLANFLEHLSKNSSILENGPTTELFDEIKKTTTSKQQSQLLEELKNRVEESKKKLEIQRKAAENALNVATGSCLNFDSNVIPGLDGDFSSVNQVNDTDKFDLTKDLDLPDNLKEFLYKFKNKEFKKINTYDDPIVKNFGSKNFETNFKNNLNDNEEEPEPMELDEEDITNTIIEVNNFDTSSNKNINLDEKKIKEDDEKFSQLDDNELVKKAKMQLEALKQMEHEQKNLFFAQQKAIALVNQTKSKSNSN